MRARALREPRVDGVHARLVEQQERALVRQQDRHRRRADHARCARLAREMRMPPCPCPRVRVRVRVRRWGRWREAREGAGDAEECGEEAVDVRVGIAQRPHDVRADPAHRPALRPPLPVLPLLLLLLLLLRRSSERYAHLLRVKPGARAHAQHAARAVDGGAHEAHARVALLRERAARRGVDEHPLAVVLQPVRLDGPARAARDRDAAAGLDWVCVGEAGWR